MEIWRQIRAIVLLPVMVLVVVPAVLLVRTPVAETSPFLSSFGGPILMFSGVPAVAIGLSLMVTTIRLFIKEGKGTLAPWNPTQKLVVRGPYRFVRNPMISGVLLVLLGETLFFQSSSIGQWTLIFFASNAAYIPLSEERGLLERFGHNYEEYKRNVPRWIPRLTPWQGS